MGKILFIYLFIYIYTPQKLIFQPNIDGLVSEYKNLEKITNFVEMEPIEGRIPDVNTECYISYDDNNLYIAFKCYDKIELVRRTLKKRDNFGSSLDDMVIIYINTLGEGKEGYSFGTNPLGVQYDGLKTPPPNYMDDWSFDAHFEVKTFICDSFWSAEFRIPFSSLRFEEKKDKQEWKFILARVRPRGTVFIYSFPPLSKNNPLFWKQGCVLLIPERIYSKEKKYEFLPYLIGSQNGLREEKYIYQKIKYSFGLSGKMRISQNLIGDYALNPDYAQIETDIPQIDVNTIYALWYPEKRPIFMEGSQIINTPMDLIYTRMINNPLYIFKLAGRINIIDLYLLSSYDENTPYILPFENASYSFPSDKKSFVNILRLKSNFINKESSIGILLFDREVKKDEFDNGYGKNFAFDTKLLFLKHYGIEGQFSYSYTKESSDTTLFYGIGRKFQNFTDKFDGERFSGYAGYIKFMSFFKNLNFNLYYKEFSPTFRSDLGYIKRNNFKERGFSINPIFYPNKYGVTLISFWGNYQKEINFDNVFKKERFDIGNSLTFSFLQLNLSCDYSIENKNILNPYTLTYVRFKNLDYTNISLNLTPFKFINFNLWVGQGKCIFYQLNKPLYERSFQSYLNLRFTKFSISKGIMNKIYYLKRYKDKLIDAQVLYTNLLYDFSKEFHFRLILTYYKKETGFYPLFTYQPHPFTIFYLGANINTIKNKFKLKGNDHQIFLKFQYWFKI